MFRDENEGGLLWAALGCPGLLWAALGWLAALAASKYVHFPFDLCSWAALGCSGLLWAALGCPGLPLGCSGLLWAGWLPRIAHPGGVFCA